MRVIKEVDGFRVLEFPALFPYSPSDVFYEIQFGRCIWKDNKVQVIWEVLRVIIHKNKEYALATALNIFENLIKPY